MHRYPRRKIFGIIVVLMLAGLACNFGGGQPEIVPTQAPPTDVPATSAPQATAVPTQETGADPTVRPAVAGLTGAQRQHLAAATVLILMTDIENGQFVPFGIGSGTVITRDGLILTNAHVARPSALGFGDADPDTLVVALNESESSPPVPTFQAEVAAVDGFLDLSVIRIVSTVDGARVDPNGLNLPFVNLGNSDDTHLGDTINIFGFPGIGGETITFTRGSVSGFSSEDPVGDRAWIKTDATIAGGNSGGLAANDFGEIIGVPTRGGAGTDSSIADCRVVQDTNGDGRLDRNDTCIPIGGFINALRPVNLAVPLIRAAQTGTDYQSPYQAGGVTGVGGSGNEVFRFVEWSQNFDDDSGCALDPSVSFPSGIEQLTAVYSYSGMTNGQDFGFYWLIDGERVVEDFFVWEFDDSDDCFPFFVHNNGDPLPDGEYTLLLYTGEGLPQVAEVSTTVGGSGAAMPAAGDVTVEGFILDADTGNPIAGAVMVVLKPGVDPDEWFENGTDDQVFDWAETDNRGYFRLQAAFKRGVEYPAFAGAASAGYLTTNGFLLFDESDPDVVTMEIELSK